MWGKNKHILLISKKPLVRGIIINNIWKFKKFTNYDFRDDNHLALDNALQGWNSINCNERKIAIKDLDKNGISYWTQVQQFSQSSLNERGNNIKVFEQEDIIQNIKERKWTVFINIYPLTKCCMISNLVSGTSRVVSGEGIERAGVSSPGNLVNDLPFLSFFEDRVVFFLGAIVMFLKNFRKALVSERDRSEVIKEPDSYLSPSFSFYRHPFEWNYEFAPEI